MNIYIIHFGADPFNAADFTFFKSSIVFFKPSPNALLSLRHTFSSIVFNSEQSFCYSGDKSGQFHNNNFHKATLSTFSSKCIPAL